MKISRTKIFQLGCILFLLFFATSSKAQFGIKTGTAVSNFYYTETKPIPYFDYDIDLRPYLGYDILWVQLGAQKPIYSPYFSAYYNIKISNRFGIRPELSYIQKGVNFSQFEYHRIIYKFKIHYLEVPLSIIYQFKQKEKSISELYFGAYTSYELKSNKKVAYHNTSVIHTHINSVNSFDGGIHIGMDYKRKLLNNYISFDMRVYVGFNNVFHMPEYWTNIYFTTQKTKNAGIYLSAGYEF